MRSIFRTRWSRHLAALLSLLAACSSTSERSRSTASGGNSGTGGVAGAGGTSGGEDGGTGGDGDVPGGAGSGGIPDGSGAGGDGGSSVSPVDVTTERLLDATLNQDYRFALEARGGSGEGFDWVLAGGRLPRGLALEEDGTLSGIPLEGGEFELDVIVTDSDGATGEASLALHVRQSRWLVYWNTHPDMTVVTPRFYAVDLASETFERTLLSVPLPANLDGADTGTVAFSPDGRFLLYQFRVTSSHVATELRMVDFDDVDASRPEDFNFTVNNLGDELIMLYGPAWSPDSRRVAFNALIEDSSGDLQYPGRFGFFNVDDVLESENESTDLKRRPEGSSTSSPDWVSPGTVVHRSAHLNEYGSIADGPLVRAAWQGDEFGEPVPLVSSTGGTYDQHYIHYLNRANQSAVIAQHSNPHCIASIDLYRFDNNEAVNMGATPLLPAPDLNRFAGVSASELKIVDAANQPIATLGPSDCNLIEWSPDGNLLGWVDTYEQQYRIARTGPNDGMETELVPESDYSTTADRPRFSSDGRWMGYRADGYLFLARIDEMAVQPAVQVSVDLVAPVGSYRFAPNGRALVYAAAEQIAGLDDLYFVDLSGGAPGPSLRISPDLSGFPNGDKLEIPPPESDQDETWERVSPLWNPWTPDSSKVFFTVRDTDNQVGDALYIVDVLDPEPRPVHVDLAPCDSYTCGMINGIGTQPLR
jgi:hypothetical protein